MYMTSSMLPHPSTRSPTVARPITITAASLCLLASACSGDPALTPEYQAACHGEPLRSIEARNRALEDGYAVHPQFHCITRASHLAMEEAEAQRVAWRSAEAVARRRTQAQARDAQLAEERERRRAVIVPIVPPYELRAVDANTASESDIAAVCGIGRETAADIVRQREEFGPFSDWANLVHRVVGVRSAQNALFASTCGLNVDGRSLDGAPPDAQAAQAIFERGLR